MHYNIQVCKVAEVELLGWVGPEPIFETESGCHCGCRHRRSEVCGVHWKGRVGDIWAERYGTPVYM